MDDRGSAASMIRANNRDPRPGSLKFTFGDPGFSLAHGTVAHLARLLEQTVVGHEVVMPGNDEGVEPTPDAQRSCVWATCCPFIHPFLALPVIGQLLCLWTVSPGAWASSISPCQG
jgi:hypothetical protein